VRIDYLRGLIRVVIGNLDVDLVFSTLVNRVGSPFDYCLPVVQISVDLAHHELVGLLLAKIVELLFYPRGLLHYLRLFFISLNFR
jgi:hypothetical protein